MERVELRRNPHVETRRAEPDLRLTRDRSGPGPRDGRGHHGRPQIAPSRRTPVRSWASIPNSLGSPVGAAVSSFVGVRDRRAPAAAAVVLRPRATSPIVVVDRARRARCDRRRRRPGPLHRTLAAALGRPATRHRRPRRRRHLPHRPRRRRRVSAATPATCASGPVGRCQHRRDRLLEDPVGVVDGEAEAGVHVAGRGVVGVDVEHPGVEAATGQPRQPGQRDARRRGRGRRTAGSTPMTKISPSGGSVVRVDLRPAEPGQLVALLVQQEARRDRTRARAISRWRRSSVNSPWSGWPGERSVVARRSTPARRPCRAGTAADLDRRVGVGDRRLDRQRPPQLQHVTLRGAGCVGRGGRVVGVGRIRHDPPNRARRRGCAATTAVAAPPGGLGR